MHQENNSRNVASNRSNFEIGLPRTSFITYDTLYRKLYCGRRPTTVRVEPATSARITSVRLGNSEAKTPRTTSGIAFDVKPIDL